MVNGALDNIIITLSNYADVVLTNSGANLRIDLYDTTGQVASSVTFTKYTFRFQFWTTYQIYVTSGSASLYVDGYKIDSGTHNA